MPRTLLTPDRLDRFARHIVLPEVGGAGQVALAGAHAVLVGLGGIGSPVLQYLAAAGVGHLTLIDDDTVAASNLQRQTIYAQADIGRAKADAAAEWVRKFDPALTVTAHGQRLTRDNAGDLLAGAGVVIDGSDTFATRLAVSDACVAAGVPLVSAAIGRFQGQVGAFAGHRADQPCYRCFVGDAFDADDCDTCAEDGVLGAMAGWAGTLGTISALRVLLDGKAALGDPQWGQVHVLDGLAPSLRTMRIAKDPGCRACG
ncbi:HesA/MoeB/ThiF family protein [Parablastomonas sp. CN1-191]|uniref:HesA/MoeB/ThiF family protein n=1 Tax=Parablastomonas sp. CN1-191 TaxID=3400908 RepID=UPI003BF90C7A